MGVVNGSEDRSHSTLNNHWYRPQFLNSRGKNLLIPGSDGYGSDPNQPKPSDQHNTPREEAVNGVDGDPDGFGQHVVMKVDRD